MIEHPTSSNPDSSMAPAQASHESRQVRPRWRWVAALVVVLALAAAYAFVQEPGWIGLDDDTTPGEIVPADSDGDGFSDEVESTGWLTSDGTVHRTDPHAADSDGDGLSDSDEAGPLAADTQVGYAHVGSSDPLLVDTDGDDLGDGDEADLDLNPFDADSDDDELEDGVEVDVVGSAPDLADSDGDGFFDGYENANAAAQGLDPLSVDVKVDRFEYASDFAKGAVLGDLNREDSLAWLAGNLASGGASLVPVVGWAFGALADARDAVGSAIHADWVGSGFSAVGAVPYVGDTAAIPAKAASFVARNPELAVGVAAAIVAMNKVPELVKVSASKKIWKSWDDLRVAGASDKALLQLEKGRTKLDDLAAARSRSNHLAAPPAKFFANGTEGETYLETTLRATATDVSTQVVASTKECISVCNIAFRRFDVAADGVAHESKVGYNVWSAGIERQIRSDAYLVGTGRIKSAHWHFYASSISNKVGADPKVLDLLDEAKIPYTIHLPG